MKKILIITTGGTITSIQSNNGLIPTDTSTFLVKAIKDSELDISVKNIMVLDSSNIQPEEWKVIATDIYNSMNYFDGIIVTHGTDTMAYTASMMCFMIQNPTIPIVFTGSQLPITHPLTDAYNNLRAAGEMCKSGYKGIFIAFDRKIIIGCRAVKVRTSGFAAFESINLKSVGKISGNGLTIRDEMIKKYEGAPKLVTNIETNVFLLKLTPTTNPNIIDLLIQSGIKGIVIEAYGAGGISFVRRDFVSKIKYAIDNNVPVVVSSQCLYETSNFNIYEVGQKVIKTGAIEALDMTSEAAVCKLMYALGQSNDIKEISKIFRSEIASEITI
ncbi:MAG: asparaginase [Acholeplasmatales bacterium]|nr:asparaginase [Acholeplasmatales bacterium]